MARKAFDPHLLAVFVGGLLTVVVAVVATAETQSWWVMAVAIAAVVLLGSAVVLDVSDAVDGKAPHAHARQSDQPAPASGPERPGLDYRGPDARHRFLVLTSEPLRAEPVLEALRRGNGSFESPGAVGVMVVSPEGFGATDITNDEGHYAAARRAEGETVASLRSASVKAVGHVGDHDVGQAIADALVLFPAERVLVFAHPAYAAAYRRAIDPAVVPLPLDIVEI